MRTVFFSCQLCLYHRCEECVSYSTFVLCCLGLFSVNQNSSLKRSSLRTTAGYLRDLSILKYCVIYFIMIIIYLFILLIMTRSILKRSAIHRISAGIQEMWQCTCSRIQPQSINQSMSLRTSMVLICKTKTKTKQKKHLKHITVTIMDSLQISSGNMDIYKTAAYNIRGVELHFQEGNTRSMWQGLRTMTDSLSSRPDGISKWVFKLCADQLVLVFTIIFNLSLARSAIILVPRKTSPACLNEHQLVAVGMKCFERLNEDYIFSPYYPAHWTHYSLSACSHHPIIPGQEWDLCEISVHSLTLQYPIP